MEHIRLLDLGLLPALQSQTVYHAVAHALTEDSPDTIILVGPEEPYVCIGFHQELTKEVDLEYCRQEGLPVLRREVGGGAVYLDRSQVFCQWVFHPDRLPYKLEDRFALYAGPLVDTYQSLGVNAYYRPVNDIHVDGRKIGGTGAATIGAAEVVVGSLMFDFNFELMARVLRVGSEKMRDKVYQSLQEYMTTLTRELGHAPDRDAVKERYVDECAAALDAEIAAGTLTEAERTKMAELDEQFVSDQWLYQKGGLRQIGVKIHADVRVVEAAFKAPGGLIRVTARIHENRIDDLTISGDFTILPGVALGALEQALRGVNLATDAVRSRIEDVYRSITIQSPGVTPEDFATAVLSMTTE